MSLTVAQQNTLTTGITNAQATTTVGGATVTREEAANIVGTLLRGGVSQADITAALSSPNIDAPTRAAFTAAMTPSGAGMPTDVATASSHAAGATLSPRAGTYPFASIDSGTVEEYTANQNANIAAARSAISDAQTAMARTPPDFAAANAAYARIGLPLPRTASLADMSGPALAAMTLMGAARADGNGVAATTAGMRAPDFRAINGMAARAHLMANMEAQGIHPSNPPTQAEMHAYVGKVAQGGTAETVRNAITDCISATLIHYRETSNTSDLSWGSTGFPTGWGDIDAQSTTGGRHRSDCQLEAFMAYDLLGAAGATDRGIAGALPARGGIGHAMAFGTIGGEKVIFSGDTSTVYTGSTSDAASAECARIYTNGGQGFRVTVGTGEDLNAVSRTAYGR